MSTQGILAGLVPNGKTDQHAIVVMRTWHDSWEIRGVFTDENRALAFISAIARRDNRFDNRTRWSGPRDVRRPLTADECEGMGIIAGWTSDYSTWTARCWLIQ